MVAIIITIVVVITLMIIAIMVDTVYRDIQFAEGFFGEFCGIVVTTSRGIM